MMALTLLAIALAQETQIVDDPFDAHVAVLTGLPSSAVSQDGDRQVIPQAYTATAVARDGGAAQQYLKMTIAYPSSEGRIGVSSASFLGGGVADFELIETTEKCVAARSRCTTTEVLSVRLPFTSTTGVWKVQFRNRSATWRGTVTIPNGLLDRNLAKAGELK